MFISKHVNINYFFNLHRLSTVFYGFFQAKNTKPEKYFQPTSGIASFTYIYVVPVTPQYRHMYLIHTPLTSIYALNICYFHLLLACVQAWMYRAACVARVLSCLHFRSTMSSDTRDTVSRYSSSLDWSFSCN